MAVTTELTNTTYADLKPEIELPLARRIALWSKLIQKARTTIESGTFLERPFAGGAPARGVGVFVGDELLNMTRRQQINRLRTEGHRVVVAINIPKKELLMNDGKKGAVRLIQSYPKTVMEYSTVDFNTYMLTSASEGLVFSTAALRGFTTLDGTDAAGVGLGVTNGILDFQPPANQTQAVHNVAKSSTTGHYNQHTAIAAWTTNGMRQLRDLYRLCASYSGMPNGGPDLIYLDTNTYANFDEARLDLVRLRIVDDKTEKSTTLEFMGFAGSDIIYDPALLRTSFTATAETGAAAAPSTGCGYFINTEHVEMPTWEVPNATPFEPRVGDQDVITSTWSGMWQLIFNHTSSHGTFVGGGT